MNTCAHCSAPLAERRLTSRALSAAFCSYACYDVAWRMAFGRQEPTGGLPVQDDVDYVDLEGPMETNVQRPGVE